LAKSVAPISQAIDTATYTSGRHDDHDDHDAREL